MPNQQQYILADKHIARHVVCDSPLPRAEVQLAKDYRRLHASCRDTFSDLSLYIAYLPYLTLPYLTLPYLTLPYPLVLQWQNLQCVQPVPPHGAASGQHLDELEPAAQDALGPHSSSSCWPRLAHDTVPLHRPQGK